LLCDRLEFGGERRSRRERRIVDAGEDDVVVWCGDAAAHPQQIVDRDAVRIGKGGIPLRDGIVLAQQAAIDQREHGGRGEGFRDARDAKRLVGRANPARPQISKAAHERVAPLSGDRDVDDDAGEVVAS
jgi:hypothetical protein